MTHGRALIQQLNTGVPGLDQVLGGGLPEWSFNLIAGQPGSGKTTLAHQIMFVLATPEQPALYFTVLGEPPIKMLRYQQQFPFFDVDKLTQCVRFVNLADEAASGALDAVLERVLKEVQASGPSFVFIDSFRSVLQAGQGGAGRRRLARGRTAIYPEPGRDDDQLAGHLPSCWVNTTQTPKPTRFLPSPMASSGCARACRATPSCARWKL